MKKDRIIFDMEYDYTGSPTIWVTLQMHDKPEVKIKLRDMALPNFEMLDPVLKKEFLLLYYQLGSAEHKEFQGELTTSIQNSKNSSNFNNVVMEKFLEIVKINTIPNKRKVWKNIYEACVSYALDNLSNQEFLTIKSMNQKAFSDMIARYEKRINSEKIERAFKVTINR
ncbi:hypothetical protein [Polynucleobacter sp. JS-Fieb-80-E5]|uniref:hypothetical protein n=1 Tax=Polynucleobacter sp. JS-Fieb-80-E5 TaxID=2081050 RepID=UPI001C0E3E67|nr:hypothetical protein [Polynucleobacter sp. JS-Fieb-80-E5]MBU3618780.1 hypothetical protein [Polynucleobacter sp. JS-Fieb-80-E5]